MSFFDGLLNIMRLNDDDEDYEFDNEDYLGDEEEEEEVAPKKPLFNREKKEEKTSSFESLPAKEKPKAAAPKATPKITPISRSSKRQQEENMEVCVIKPTTVDDAREITETLLNGRTVVLNVEGLDMEIAQRIIDFTSGSCFAISGNLQKISNYIFIITPANVDISGDFQSIVNSFDNGGIAF